MYHDVLKNREKIFAIAPMMDWTDRHCRFFHRVMTKRSLLYTEMVVAEAIIRGNRDALLGHDPLEHPLALQIGGSDPEKLGEAVRLADEFGFDEINLNVGCPSDRVQSGAFGACLMREPKLVGKCVAAMKGASAVPVTVKCRIGVDDQDPGPALDALAQAVWEAGADGLWVHARKALLSGLSPAKNRIVPELDYSRVRQLKSENPRYFIGLNGGLESLDQACAEMQSCEPPLDGAMFGRAAYRNPGLLRSVDREFFNAGHVVPFDEIIGEMVAYSARHIAGGGRLHHVARHMTGLFHGMQGARRWRRLLAGEAARSDAGPDVIERAFAAVELDAGREAA